VGGAVEHPVGGIPRLRRLLDGEHGGALLYDLNSRGWTRRDLGRRLSWPEFANFVTWLPQTEASAYFRARHPGSWWWTPEHDFLALILQATQGANWQRAGGKGNPPKRIEKPDDRPPRVGTSGELADRRTAYNNELARRRRKRGA
jgi:hypothetical protein